MKKLVSLLLSASVAIGACAMLAACADEDEGWQGETVTITCLNANAKAEEKTVPKNPERVAIFDYAVLDMMDLYGVGDKVVSSCQGTLEYLQSYWNKMKTGDIADLGNLKQYNMEVLQQSEPDIIFIGGRQSADYAAMEAIAPVVYLTATEGDLINTTLANARTVGKIFGKTDAEVDAIIAGYKFEERIAALKAVSGAGTENAKTAMVLMYNSANSITAIAANGRCSLVSSEVGFTLKEVESSGSSSGRPSGGSSSGGQHGDTFSFETIVKLNPDYIFVLNRGFITSSTTNDTVVGDIRNKLTENTTAARDGHIIVFDNPDAWYTASGGLQALNTMIEDLESALISK